jgi:hypothetical protein
MESDQRYYWRRASEELYAAARAVTPAAQLRRRQLAALYVERLRALAAHRTPSSAPLGRLTRPADMAEELRALSGCLFEWPLPTLRLPKPEALAQLEGPANASSEWPLPLETAA